MELRVAEEAGNDNSVLFLHPTVADELTLFRGDTVKVSLGSKGVMAVVLFRDELERTLTVLSQSARETLGANQGDMVRIDLAEVQYGRKITILPIADGIERTEQQLVLSLGQYFIYAFRPVQEGLF